MGILNEWKINPDDYSGFLERAKGRKVVVLLSSGGLRIVCHLPLLRIIESLGLHIDELWGVSAGSIAGGLWASGRTAAELEDEILSVKKDQIYEFFILTGLRGMFPSKNAEKAGLITGRKLENYIANLVGPCDNPLLDIHDFHVLAYNRSLNCKSVIKVGSKPGTIVISEEKGGIVKVEKGTLANMLRASFSTPVMFRPKRLNGQYYIDGGIAENYPIFTAFRHYEDDVLSGRESRGLLIMGVNIGYSGKFAEKASNIISSVTQCYDIVGNELSRLQIALVEERIKNIGVNCEVITIDPGIYDLPLTDFKRVRSTLETALFKTVERLSNPHTAGKALH